MQTKSKKAKKMKGRGLEFLDEDGTWVKVLTESGDPYYWNTDSGETRWER